MDIKFERAAHEAMATPFEVFIAATEPTLARQAANAAFAEIDRIEQALSRYVQSSDISRINHLAKGQATPVSECTFECLKAAARVHRETGGAFDVTIGPLMACWRDKDESLRQPGEEELAAARARVGMNLIELDEAEQTVRVKVSGVQVDLGGIGKGYAVDQAAVFLEEWGIEAALVSAGGSTVRAMDAPPGAPGWPVGVGGVGNQPHAPHELELCNKALSGSGVHVRGRHIMDPRTGRPTRGKVATWALCPTATVADALSTAFMVMTPEEVEAYCRKHLDTSAMLVLEGDIDQERRRFGEW